MTPPNVQFIPAASGLSLIIHDDFNGPGPGDTYLYGTLPDQVDNGNTWQQVTSQLFPIGNGFKETTSGYAYKTNYDRSGSSFDDKVLIDCGSSRVRLETRCLCGNQDFAGLCAWGSTLSDSPGIVTRFRRNNNGRFVVLVNDGTTSTVVYDTNNLTTAGYDLVNPCFLTLEVDGTIVTAKLFEQDETTLVASYTGDISAYGLTPTNFVGMEMAGFSNSTRYHLDFKVYT